MAWLIAILLVLGIAALAGLFVLHAFLLHRDMTSRFRRVRVRIEQQAQAVLEPLFERNQ